jgi:thiol-disulfide isomerase/thioredoxin
MKNLLTALLLVIAGSSFAQKAPKLHKPASDFTLKTPAGEDLRLSSLKGQYVLVDFWASWCGPCRAEIPHLKELYTKYHGSGLEILSISIDAHTEAWKKALAQEQMPWQQVLDSYSGTGNYSDICGAYGVAAIPYTVLLDKDGIVIAINPEPHSIDKQLKKIFGN